MAKRFTATEKWSDPWYRSLSSLHKVGWQYLCDNCDNAGVIDIDRELANFQVRDTLDWDALIEAAAERIVRLKSGKLWLSRFIKFQYGHEFPKNCDPHRAVLKLLDMYAKSERVIAQYREGLPTLKDKDKDKAKDKNSGKGNAKGKPKFTAADVPVPDGFDTPEVRQAIGDWMAYKIKCGKGYKDPAFIGRKVAEFAGTGPGAFIAAVNSCIGSNYDGLFQAKGPNGTATNTRPSHRHRG